MFQIKFNGYKKDKEECAGLFFVGRKYPCSVVDSNRYYQTYDENGNIVKFKSISHDSCYDFSRIDTQSKALDEHDNKMKYRMNGVDVTKSFFDDKLLEVEMLKSRGVSVFIDFEVYFE